MPTAIEWTDETWNPATGCSKVSPGCAFCYAERVSHRYGFTSLPWTEANAAENVALHPDRLHQPLHWARPRRIFVNSMSDLFHEDVPDEFIDQVFAVMALTPGHTYQVLTKRPERMRAYLGSGETISDAVADMGYDAIAYDWPLENVWAGVSAEYQRQADERIPLLLQTPATVRFVSAEPLLGPIDLQPYLWAGWDIPGGDSDAWWRNSHLDWVITGGESGGPEARRLIDSCGWHLDSADAQGWKHGGGNPKPEALAWVRSIRDQCNAAGVAYLHKQWGGPTPKSGGRELDGRTWDEYPQTRQLVHA